MKPEDQAAFEAWCPYQGPTTLQFMLEAYQFGLSRRDAQPAVAGHEARKLAEAVYEHALTGTDNFPFDWAIHCEMLHNLTQLLAAEAAKGGV